MRLTRHEEREALAGPADWFTGRASIVVVDPPATSVVTFDAGARTAWHTHPRGQRLHVLTGQARIGTRAGVRTAGPGDLVEIGPGEWHWHGASRSGPMSHVAVSHADETGVDASWGDHVTEEEYDA